MSEEMAPSWRSLASAASRSIKGYIAQQRELKQGYPAARGQPQSGAEQNYKKQSWSQWAGQKLRRGSQNEYDTSGDRLSLFPGWATRRYREPPKGLEDGAPFDIDVFVSGYACKLTGFDTRAGKAFLRLAKGFAALPKLPVGPAPLSRSTEDLLTGTHLPPLPDEITDETEMEALDDRLRRLEFDARSVDSGRASGSMPTSASYSSRIPSSTSYSANGNGSFPIPSQAPLPILPGSSTDLQRWHANLEARLHPFWSSVLSNRTVRVSLYASDPSLYEQYEDSASSDSSATPDRQPIATRQIPTAVDGSFQVKFSVPWEHMCMHPGALHIAFGGPELEQDLFVVAELLTPPSPTPTPPPGQYQVRPPAPFFAPVAVSSSIPVPLTHSSIRVISDIDDTVKLSGILGGARAVFRNVFVKDLRDSVIRGMGDWYMSMWKRGVQFHYVSNGPFELLPVVNEFFQISQLPPGSIRLRSYGGRSLFNGLLSAPAMRKRTAVLDVLNHFPEAKFFLVGDSGEQDLELYAETARERPDQILAIYIRDASARGDSSVRPLDDPTGAEAYRFALDPGQGTPSSFGSRRSFGTYGRRSGRSSPSRSMSDAQAMSSTSPVVPKKPTRSYSGTEMMGLSSSASGDSTSSFSDYFTSSSVPPVHSPIVEEPHGSPEMMIASEGKPWPPPGFSKPPPGSQTELRESGRWQPQSQAQIPQVPQSDGERKRADLQSRLWKARLDVSPHIPIRIFREPEECVEAQQILDKLQAHNIER
ncbi:hypothetical protein L227DRAFT_571731 [Lentinus tigrinus ALCF2SS1-6]|uniref:Phosphatidate phosphatase APP1 catalytic domain-containing protein n=1 Tax=Lentinus tigrinus ALCF2SS1-6 TaxID=1328759 RepID=A0A5C2SK96_9APHY|nr:hypothetical protein L227DRAFT_571731 [Lentinus tigrinus ALCF2SS1-6]